MYLYITLNECKHHPHAWQRTMNDESQHSTARMSTAKKKNTPLYSPSARRASRCTRQARCCCCEAGLCGVGSLTCLRRALLLPCLAKCRQTADNSFSSISSSTVELFSGAHLGRGEAPAGDHQGNDDSDAERRGWEVHQLRVRLARRPVSAVDLVAMGRYEHQQYTPCSCAEHR